MNDIHARFLNKILIDDSGCWLWQGKLGQGSAARYGYFKVGGKWLLAHRVSVELHHGPIPEGYEVDHLCFVRQCVNPDHLEAVTPIENIDRARRAGRLSMSPPVTPRTHCKRGHPFAGENLRVAPWRGNTTRVCKACCALHSANYRARVLEGIATSG